MKTSGLLILGLFTFLNIKSIGAQGVNIFKNLEKGNYNVGFRLIEKTDSTRTVISNSDGDYSLGFRPVRTYVWYPAKASKVQYMLVNDYINLAKGDFCNDSENGKECISTVPLEKGLSLQSLEKLKQEKTISKWNPEFFDSKFPVIVLGQGLYYESPLTHFVLCEFLASYGFVVVTCPLKGTQYRLVNLNVTDLETLVRDLEFSLSQALSLPVSDKDKLAVIGYDMGGMAGIILATRNPKVSAFISIDAGILYLHYSGLPNSHPNYNLSNLNIPWLHITQSRFCPGGFEKAHPSNAMKQKMFGDNCLLLLNSTNHGAFTSYAMFGIENPVPTYWDTDFTYMQSIYETVCNYSLDFLNAYLNNNVKSKKNLVEKVGNWGDNNSFEMINNKHLSVSKDMIINKIITEGAQQGISLFNNIDKEFSNKIPMNEKELNWLGYHFLYWWGRPAEAILVFEFITELFPESANAFDSLAEAWLVNGNKEKAIQFYQKSLEMNPDNENAKEMLEKIK